MGRYQRATAAVVVALVAGLGSPAMAGRELSAVSKITTTFTFHSQDGKTTIAMETSDAPELSVWMVQKLAPVLMDWYPKIVAMLPSGGFTAPSHFTVAVRDMDGVAYTTDTDIVVSKSWIKNEMNGQAVGSLVHEMVHVVQQYRNAAVPGWLVEGMADYIRWFKYEPQSHGADLVWMRQQGKSFSPHYDDSYRVTANFLSWVVKNYDADIVGQMNAAMREDKYKEGLWKTYTGKTAVQLGEEWSKEIRAELAKTNM